MTTMRYATVSRPNPRKFQSPSVAERLILRTGVLVKIEEALGKTTGSSDVFLVTAPPGYGKTTALAQWAVNATFPVAWYHLDQHDDDPVALIQGIVYALRARMPRATWQTEHMLRRVHDSALSPMDQRRAVEVLIADIQRNIRKPVALIFTGLSDLMPKGAAYSIFDQLLMRPPDHLRIVLETREAPSLRLSPLMAQRRLSGVGLDDLRLDDTEFTALLEVIQAPREREYREKLRNLSAGWVMGVLLATGSLVPDFLDSYAAYSSSCDELNRAAIFDYLAQEVIDALPEDLRQFACEAAVLTSMTEPLCMDLLRAPNARRQLAMLEQRTGLVTRIGRRPEEPIYRFQPMLRQALLDALEQTPGGVARRRELHALAGSLLERAGDYEEAFQHYLAVKDFDQILCLIDATRGMLIRACRGATLMRWLDLLPEEIREKQPHLHVLLAELYRQAGRMSEAYTAATRVRITCQSRAAKESELAARALAVCASVKYAQGRYVEAQHLCEEALEIAPEGADEVRVRIHFTLASCLSFVATPDAALTCLAEIESRCASSHDLWSLARLHYYRSTFLIARGSYRLAEFAAKTALLYAQEADDEIIAITTRLNLGSIEHYLGEPSQAREHLEAAHTMSVAAGYVRGQAYALTNLGNLELHVERVDSAIAAYHEALKTMASMDDLRLRMHTCAELGFALVLKGEIAQAVALIEPLMASFPTDSQGADWAHLAMSRAIAYYYEGQFKAAQNLLIPAARIAQAHDATNDNGRAQLYLAAVQLAQGNESEAIEITDNLLKAIGSAEGIQAMLPELRHLPEICSLAERLAHPFASQLFANIAANATAQPTNLNSSDTRLVREKRTEETTEEIRVFALGNARILIGTESVTGWRRSRMRELLYFMLEQGKPVGKEVILEALWPEKDVNLAEIAFRKARHHLKELFGRPCLEPVGGRADERSDQRWGLALMCWSDVREFETLCRAGNSFAEQGAYEDATRVFQQALTYWNGDYLEEVYSDWVVLRRDALRRLYLSSLETLASLEMRSGQTERAAQHYYQVLDAEPYRESAHRGLMTYFARRGNLAQAIAQFERCSEAVYEEFGAAPGPEMHVFYQTLKAKMSPTQEQTSLLEHAHG